MSDFRLVDKKGLKTIYGIPYSHQHIARLEKAGKFPKRMQIARVPRFDIIGVSAHYISIIKIAFQTFMESIAGQRGKDLFNTAKMLSVSHLLTSNNAESLQARSDVIHVLKVMLSALKSVEGLTGGIQTANPLSFAATEAAQVVPSSDPSRSGDELVDDTIGTLKLAAFDAGVGDDLSSIQTAEGCANIIDHAIAILSKSNPKT